MARRFVVLLLCLLIAASSPVVLHAKANYGDDDWVGEPAAGPFNGRMMKTPEQLHGMRAGGGWSDEEPEMPTSTLNTNQRGGGLRGWNPTKRTGKKPSHGKKPSAAGNGGPGAADIPSINAMMKRQRKTRHPEDELGGLDFDGIPAGDSGFGSKSKAMNKCVTAALKVCPSRVMHDNFAMFTKCIVDLRDRLPGECSEWALQQEPCLGDLTEKCGKRNPRDTTLCLMNQKKLSDACRNSPYFTSMVQGFEKFEEKMRSGGGFEQQEEMMFDPDRFDPRSSGRGGPSGSRSSSLEPPAGMDMHEL